MRAAYLHTDASGQSRVVIGEKPRPSPETGELLIRVGAVGITPGELQWYPTMHTPEGSAREDSIPGHEFSGWVESVGARVEGLVRGCEVFGMNSWFRQGATAEYCIAVHKTSQRSQRASLMQKLRLCR